MAGRREGVEIQEAVDRFLEGCWTAASAPFDKEGGERQEVADRNQRDPSHGGAWDEDEAVEARRVAAKVKSDAHRDWVCWKLAGGGVL